METWTISDHTGESDLGFHRGMVDRMSVSFHKYGRFRTNYKGCYEAAFLADLAETFQNFLQRWEGKTSGTAGGNAILFILRRLLTYVKGGKTSGGRVKRGNTEYLIDAANGLMIEFICPQVPKARFKATDSEGSTGFAGLSEREIAEFRKKDKR